MKKLILTALFLSSSLAFAQIKSGDVVFYNVDGVRYAKGKVTGIEDGKASVNQNLNAAVHNEGLYIIVPVDELVSAVHQVEKEDLSRLAEVMISNASGGYIKATVETIYGQGELIPSQFWYHQSISVFVENGKTLVLVSFPDAGKDKEKLVELSELSLVLTATELRQREKGQAFEEGSKEDSSIETKDMEARLQKYTKIITAGEGLIDIALDRILNKDGVSFKEADFLALEAVIKLIQNPLYYTGMYKSDIALMTSLNAVKELKEGILNPTSVSTYKTDLVELENKLFKSEVATKMLRK